jgi:transcriptional regulator of acetoin/glycerol metabolism
MRQTKGHISGANGAAARLGLKRTTLNSKLKKLRISRIDYM